MISIGKETALNIYQNMVRTRFLDDKIDELVASGIGITQHSTRGQEATQCCMRRAGTQRLCHAVSSRVGVGHRQGSRP